MKTIAIIASCDTKFREAGYMRDQIRAQGIGTMIIDVATGPNPSYNADISREEVIRMIGTTWEEMEPKTKGEKIEAMKDAVSLYVRKLYREGRIHGIVAAGGLQNTVMATHAMHSLPIGFPKVMATTVASGKKTFDQVVGNKDIVTIPSICDFTGLNMVTRHILANACACCVGMVHAGGGVLEKPAQKVVGVTLMGITNTGACAAIDELERNGIEAIGFHSTGVGGTIMENMALDGLIDGILDMTTHELSMQDWPEGFSFGEDEKTRLVRTIANRIPLVACPGGLDFIDFQDGHLPPRMDERKYMNHNGNTYHIKLLPEETPAEAERFASRIEKADYPVRVLLPTDGMRHNTRPGEELYDPRVDQIIIDRIMKIDNPNVKIITVPGNLDTEEWGIQAARHMIEVLNG